MTDLTFTINSTSFAGYVRSGSGNIQTTQKPVYGSKYTDLNGTDHYILLRWRTVLKVNLRALSPTEVSTLLSSLASQPVGVTFRQFGASSDTTMDMVVTDINLSDAIGKTEGHWVEQPSITLTQV